VWFLQARKGRRSRTSKLYRCACGREQADEHLTTATMMYREMGMMFWLKTAEAVSDVCRRDDIS